MLRLAGTAIGTLAIVLSGCTTHLESVKAGPSAVSRRGAPYMLQFTEYKVVLTRRVVDCGSELKVVNKAEVTSTLVDDGAHAYVIPFDSLRHPFKISDLKVTYTDGRLTSVNASSEDRTAQTVLAAAQGIGKVVLAASTGIAVGAGGIEGCTDEVGVNLKAGKQAEADVASEKAAIDRLTSEVTRLTAAFAASGNSDAQRPALAKAVNLLDAARLRLTDAEARLKTANAFLSHVTTVTWPEDSLTFDSSKSYPIPRSAIEKWWDIPQGGLAEDVWEKRKQSKYDEIANPLQVWLAIARVGSYGRDPISKDGPDNGTPEDGIRFRLPANGKLLLCEKVACRRDASDVLTTEFAGPVQQLGHIFYAPFSSPAFSNGTFELTLDAQGRPTKMGIARTSSSAETIAGLARDSAGEFAKGYAAIDKTPAERAAEELASLESAKKIADARAASDPESPAKQLAALELQKKLADARLALDQAPTYELTRLTVIAEAQKKYNDALGALQPGVDADAVAQRAAIETDTSLLKAEAARIEAQIVLREARARLGDSR